MVSQKCAVKTIALCGMLVIGCWGEDLTNVPDTLPVTGNVTLNGSPLPGATVIFSDGKEYTAMGVTDGTGKFSLKTRFNSVETKDGAPPRTYSVTISKTIPPDGMSEELYESLKKQNRERRKTGKIPERQDRIRPRVQVIPPQYSHAGVSDLEVVVRTGQENNFPFALVTNQ